MSPRFSAGDHIVVSEQWHGRLWSAIPHVFVGEHQAHHLTYVNAGTRWACATNRGLREVEAMTREQRKLEALATLHYRVNDATEPLAMLHFFTEDSWSRVNLAWTADGTFIGWYVNFELPPLFTDDGIVTKDLVLDITVGPDRQPHWKDREDFDLAIERGVLSEWLRPTLLHEAERVQDQLDAQTGPFDSRWLSWQPPPDWDPPQLPTNFQPYGSAWVAGPGDPVAWQVGDDWSPRSAPDLGHLTTPTSDGPLGR